MKGERGTCTQGDKGFEVRRTKFDTEAHAKAGMHMLQGIAVIPMDYVVYKCVCGYWHFGKDAWGKKFGKT